MEKKKSPSIRGRSKKYDFETPLNPFEGESLKGIAAFIESSLTLQTPAPLVAESNGSQSQMQPENLTAADSSCSHQYHPISGSSADHYSVSSTRAADTIDIGAEIKIGTPSTPEERLGDHQTRARLTEPFAGTNNVGIISTPVTLTNKHQNTPETSTLNTTNLDNDSNEHMPPSAREAPRPRYEPNVEETWLSGFAISKNTHLPEHGNEETQGVIGTLKSSTTTNSGSEAKYDSSMPPQENPVSSILGTLNSFVSSTHITPDSTTISEPSVSDDKEKDFTILGRLNSSVSSTPITPEIAAQREPSENGALPTQSGILGTPNLSVSSTHQNILHLKLHPAVRGQDGLNKGEEKIYTFLWRTTYRSKEVGKPVFKSDGGNIEISLRELARKVGLGLANCAWHMRCLEEKGCIAKVKATDHYHAAVYYVREFGEILQWRKEHGLTHFIQRGHLAAFVDPQSGMPITRFRGQTRTIYRGKSIASTPSMSNGRVLNTIELSTPNTAYSVLNSTMGSAINSSTPGVIDSSTQLNETIRIEAKLETQQASTSHDAPSELITLLHNISPAIDHEAAVLLWNECCARAPNCTVEEVLYFTRAKAAILEPSKIRNPIGFLIAAVPKCFEGETFGVFRRDQSRRQQETLRMEAEERSQALRFEQEAQREAETYRVAEERLAALSQEERTTLYEQIKTELRTKYPRLQWPDRQAHEDRIRLGMIRELQRQLLTRYQSPS